MTAANFTFCDKRVLVYEGGKVNNPRDPGGKTNQGVIQRVYDGYRRRKGMKPRDVYLLEDAERDEIYRDQYWTPIRGDDLPAGVDLVVYDGAVNSGPVQSIKWLQRALTDAGLYHGSIDGHVGEGTLSAIEQHTDIFALIKAICGRRMTFLKALKVWPTFGKGWTRRVADVQRAAITLAQAGTTRVPAPFGSDGQRKASISDAKDAPQTAAADVSAGSGIGAATLTQATTALQPLVETSHTIAYIFTGLTVLGVLLTVGGLLWGMWARKRRAELHDALDLAPLPAPALPVPDDAAAPESEAA